VQGRKRPQNQQNQGFNDHPQVSGCRKSLNRSLRKHCEKVRRFVPTYFFRSLLGVVFTPATLHNPHATAGGVKEFSPSARHPWVRSG